MRFAVEQIGQRPRAQRPGDEIGNAPLGIGNAAWPAARVARASLGEAPTRVARARDEEIRSKQLRFLDSAFGEQEGAGRSRWIDDDFRHVRNSSDAALGGMAAFYVLDMFLSMPTFRSTRIQSRNTRELCLCTTRRETDDRYGAERRQFANWRRTTPLRRFRAFAQAHGSAGAPSFRLLA